MTLIPALGRRGIPHKNIIKINQARTKYRDYIFAGSYIRVI